MATGSVQSSNSRLARVLLAIDRLSAIAAFGAGLALVILAINVAADVVGRAFFNTPVRGTLEYTAHWWMPTLTLLAFAFTERRQEHIKVTILLDALPLRFRQIVEGSFGILAVILLAILTRHTLTEAIESAEIGQTTASSPPISIWPFKYVAVAGVALLTLQLAATTLRHFLGLVPQGQNLDSDEDPL